MLNKKIASELAIGIILILATIVGGIFWLQNKKVSTNSNQQKACTMEAKLCDDGSYVSRTGPNCEFTPCPENKTSQMANPASVYCVQNGGKSEIKTAPDGSQTGYCKFDDGSECEEWAYFRKECEK
jgi:putative hemolysin